MVFVRGICGGEVFRMKCGGFWWWFGGKDGGFWLILWGFKDGFVVVL